MSQLTKLRLYALRAIYMIISLGLFLNVWPDIVVPNQRLANEDSVIQSLLGAVALLTAIGVRYPLKMLPILIFELLWKSVWVVGFALPTWINTGLDAYAKGTLFACLLGIVLVPIAVPWHYIYKHYIRAETKY